MTLFRLILGAIGGGVATGPMTVAMIELHRRLPKGERHPLPPREITAKIVKAAGLAGKISPEELSSLTLLNHFAYGGAAGAVYLLAVPEPRRQAVLKGLGFGVVLWALSYLGLLPGFAILKPATQHTWRRNGLMIGVHLVWGLMLSGFVKVLLDEKSGANGALVAGSGFPHREAR